MAAVKRTSFGGSRREPGTPAMRVVHLDARRIERALAGRSRYKYVRPRVVPEGLGWKVVSPNCSRNIDPAGGEIDIAWLVPPLEGGGWQLYARDHAAGCWALRLEAGSLAVLLERLCADPQREFWR